MSWGYKILILYLGFVTIILTLVFSAFNYEVQIVASDYYERELYQQDIIDGNFNLIKIEQKTQIETGDHGVKITLPEILSGESKSGELWFYHIVRKDRDYQIQFENHPENHFHIPPDKISRGNYILKLRWTQENTPYYLEERIQIR